ncbi:unnamed protein product [Rangifer tarandus platyrhynchus]|uniref:Olduvai domain-containing protein n=1 Tax=Rangifer tarandus platyrhynchus TaxID=3082113 RepID=A0ABN8XQM9_RANTA|nr:unnamed protein product [Rangifer tarandus platyrhynchus]
MAECLPSLSDLRAERTLAEINQELQLQLEKYKQDFRDLTEKFLISQATAYSLANHLQKYKCEACKGIVESVLGEKLPGEARRPAEKLAEKPTLDERLRTCDILIRSQARELTQLRQTLQNGKDDSALLKQHLKDLLTHSDLDKHQRQGFRESLSEGYRLAERLACKLSPEIPNSLSSTSLTLTTVCSVSPRMCDTLIRSQARELTQLQQTLRDGKDDPVLLSQHLEDLLTHNDLDSHQGQGFRESLFEGHWLAERLACKLSPECLPSLLDLRAERTLAEINQELRLQLEKYKQDFRDLTEKFLISQATAYSLANHLQKYKCDACKDIVESVLGEKLPGEARRPAEKLAEKPTLDERLRTCDILIRSQARELTQLRQTLQNGKDDSALLKQHLKDLLTHSDLDKHQRQGFRESLSEGYRLAERLACKLSPEIDEDEDDEQAQETPTPSMELQEVEKKEVHEESKDECVLMPSILQGISDKHQPYRDDKFNSNELEVDVDLDGPCGCGHAKDEIPTNISASTPQEGFACNQPYNDGKVAFDEENVKSAVDGTCRCSHAEEDEIPTGLTEKQNDHDDRKGPEVVAPRYSRQMPQMGEYGVPQNSLDDYYLTYSGLPSLSDSFWPYRSTAIFSPEDLDVSYARDVTGELTHPSCFTICSPNPTNLSMEQLVVEENEIQPDSLDECYLASSIGHHLEGSCHSSRSVSFPTEKREIFLALDVNGDTCEDSQQEPVSFPASELPTSQAQLQKSTHVTECLQWQLDQHLDCGDSKPILGLCSTNRAFTTNPDSGNQGPLFLKLDASIRMKNPPKLEGEGSTASTHEQPVCKKIKGLSGLKQKILSRKVLFGKWRLAFRFPGLQA